LRQITQVLCSLILVAGSATVVRAQTQIDPSSLTDPKVRIDDPTCPAGSYCVTIELESTTPITIGPYDPFKPPNNQPNDPFVLSVANPPGSYSVPPIYTCGSNIFDFWLPTGTFSFPPLSITFTGCDFWGGTIPAGMPITVSSTGGPVVLNLPSGFSCIDGNCMDGVMDLAPEVTPEPGTALLYFTGLLLFVAVIGKRDFLFRESCESLK
jgi:hypothetical protein